MDLSECRAKLETVEMDDRVKRDGRGKLAVCCREFQQIPLTEIHLRAFPAAHCDRGRGQVDTDHADTPPGQPGCRVSWPAPQVSNWCALASLLGKASQQGPVERLAVELIAELLQIRLATMSQL